MWVPRMRRFGIAACHENVYQNAKPCVVNRKIEPALCKREMPNVMMQRDERYLPPSQHNIIPSRQRRLDRLPRSR